MSWYCEPCRGEQHSVMAAPIYLADPTSHDTGERFCITCGSQLRQIDTSDLDERFTRFYVRRERVEVTWKAGFEDYTGYGARSNGRKARFYVGKSTGWKPIYLMVLRRNSIGGPAILSDAVERIDGLGQYR